MVEQGSPLDDIREAMIQIREDTGERLEYPILLSRGFYERVLAHPLVTAEQLDNSFKVV